MRDFSDEKLAQLSLTNKRASEKTQIARNDAKAIRADYEAKGMRGRSKLKNRSIKMMVLQRMVRKR